MSLSNHDIQHDEKFPISMNNLIFEERKSYLILKRISDIILSFIGILILLPFLFSVGLCIKIEDPKGSILFKQKRVGLNGETFYMYKFRSMISNAEDLLEELKSMNETTGAMFKMKNDPRITKIGRLLRKTSIDELPQLWNVLLGNMSLVGPRPPLPSEVTEYTEYEKQRLLVMPGCTGLWQVSGRSNLGFEEMVELDLEYISNRNFYFDIKIVFKTILVLLNFKGAY